MPILTSHFYQLCFNRNSFLVYFGKAESIVRFELSVCMQKSNNTFELQDRTRGIAAHPLLLVTRRREKAEPRWQLMKHADMCHLWPLSQLDLGEGGGMKIKYKKITVEFPKWNLNTVQRDEGVQP